MKLITVSAGSDTRLQVILDPRPLTPDEVKQLRNRLDAWLGNVALRDLAALCPDCLWCGDTGRLADNKCGHCPSGAVECVMVGPTRVEEWDPQF